MGGVRSLAAAACVAAAAATLSVDLTTKATLQHTLYLPLADSATPGEWNIMMVADDGGCTAVAARAPRCEGGPSHHVPRAMTRPPPACRPQRGAQPARHLQHAEVDVQHVAPQL